MMFIKKLNVGLNNLKMTKLTTVTGMKSAQSKGPIPMSSHPYAGLPGIGNVMDNVWNSGGMCMLH